MTRDTLVNTRVTPQTRLTEWAENKEHAMGQGADMEECVRVEVEIECGRHSELLDWAERLKTTPEELVKRAISAWLTEMGENPV